MVLSQLLFAGSASVFILLGATHGLQTLRDLSRPRSFTPTNEAVRDAMVAARLRFAPQVSIWRAWLGFNLTHSLGLAVFGTSLLLAAVPDFEVVSSRTWVTGSAILVSGLYTGVAFRFFFWAPTAGCALGCLGFVLSALIR